MILKTMIKKNTFFVNTLRKLEITSLNQNSTGKLTVVTATAATGQRGRTV